MQGTLERLHAVARLELGALSQRFHARDHGVTVQHTGDVMRRERCGFATATAREVGEQNVNQSAADFSEGVAVEEQKRSGAMTMIKEIQRFEQRQAFLARFFPFNADLLVSFRIIAVLSFSSFARSLVEADDRLPAPVLDKRGSGL